MTCLPFADDSFCHGIKMPGVWLERGRLKASDTLLMDSPLGLAGQRCMASIFFVAGIKLEQNRRQAALEVAWEVIESHALSATAGATSSNAQIVVVEAMALLRQVWHAWRGHVWQQQAFTQRIWSM